MTITPSLLIYSVTMIVLCLNVLGLWAYSGYVRARAKTTPNPEDIGKSGTLSDKDPPEVARVLRAHRNAADNIIPFAVLALVFVLLGASPLAIGAFAGVFTLARLAHTLSYLNEKQPWRSISFAVGAASTLTLAGFIAKAVISAV